jgi:hypothetical protein
MESSCGSILCGHGASVRAFGSGIRNDANPIRKSKNNGTDAGYSASYKGGREKVKILFKLISKVVVPKLKLRTFASIESNAMMTKEPPILIGL